jgi:predicted flavoprotein YhiN
MQRWKLSRAAEAIVAWGNFATVEDLAAEVKACRVELSGARPVSEAISSAGGVLWSELDENLMLRNFPGIYVCGEMIDWDAPTGGYLLQAAFALGTRVGKAAALD